MRIVVAGRVVGWGAVMVASPYAGTAAHTTAPHSLRHVAFSSVEAGEVCAQSSLGVRAATLARHFGVNIARCFTDWT
jgi:hypothetical protein